MCKDKRVATPIMKRVLTVPCLCGTNLLLLPRNLNGVSKVHSGPFLIWLLGSCICLLPACAKNVGQA